MKTKTIKFYQKEVVPIEEIIFCGDEKRIYAHAYNRKHNRNRRRILYRCQPLCRRQGVNCRSP